jgi:hypothetical protein
MPRWISKFPCHDPPIVKPRSAYDLEDSEFGGVVFVLAPGSSFDKFPREELYKFTTIGVNSIAELFSPAFWLFQEGVLCKKYHSIYTSRWIPRIVTTWDRATMLRPLLPEGKGLYCYDFKHRSALRMRKDKAPEGKPYWYDSELAFVPGHNSVAANAMSLAVLMKPSLLVLVGIDLRYKGDYYYAHGVKRNPGPRFRDKALSASRAWMGKAAKRGVWAGPEIITTSPWLKLRGVRRVTVEDALEKAEGVLCRKSTAFMSSPVPSP